MGGGGKMVDVDFAADDFDVVADELRIVLIKY